jgi:hypothetical protein
MKVKPLIFMVQSQPSHAGVEKQSAKRRPADLIQQRPRESGHRAGCAATRAAERQLMVALGFSRLKPTEEFERALRAEESAERERDRQYSSPLRADLEKLRHAS